MNNQVVYYFPWNIMDEITTRMTLLTGTDGLVRLQAES